MEIVWVAILSATVNSAGDDDATTARARGYPGARGGGRPLVDEGGGGKGIATPLTEQPHDPVPHRHRWP